MIKDLELLYDIKPLFTNRVLIWGLGQEGCAVLKEMRDMGAGQKGFLLCDSDKNKWGKMLWGNKIMPPSFFKESDLKDVIVCIMAGDRKAQDEIIESISEMINADIDIYTCYEVKWGIYYGLGSPYIDESYRQKKIIEHETYIKEQNVIADIGALRYFAFAPLHNDEIILVYQPGKAGSSAVYSGLKKCGKYVLHSHSLTCVGDAEDALQKLVDCKSGKIISLVREPISRTLASMWQNISSVKFYSPKADMKEIENFFWEDGFEEKQFTWFNREMKKVFNIDIYKHKFDKERGWQIIRSGNIELLLMKMEKLNELETVIGDFVGIKDFKLENVNVGSEKPYRFAYQQYKERFYIPSDRLKIIYENKYVQHFYTEEECRHFFEKYSR